MRLARLCSLVVALVLCAWFTLGIRQAHDAGQANAILFRQHVSSAQAAHADSLLRTAETLNPDSQVDMLRARAAALEHDRARGGRILQDVVRREPMNLQGWVLVAEASKNVPELQRAEAHIDKLDPLVTR